MRGLAIDPNTATEINTMTIKGAGKEGLGNQLKHQKINLKMKFDTNGRIPKDWADGNIGNVLSNIKEQIFNIILTNADYMMG